MTQISHQAAPLPRLRRLRLSATLSAYIARQFALRLATFFFGLVGVIYLVTVVDLLDRMANKQEIGLPTVFNMALLKLPYLSQEVLPFIVLFAGLATFWRLTRSHELVVARAAGISVWQFLFPVLAVAIVLGAFTVTMLNPLGAVMLSRFDQLESRHLREESNFLAVSKNGLWLRQADETGQSVIHAERVSPDSLTLHDVIVFRYQAGDRFDSRIDANRAELRDGHWRLYEAWTAAPDTAAQFAEELDIKTDLTAEKIQESFAPPETISFWSLPGFIELLEEAGFSGQRHRLQWHRLLAIPVLLSAMVILAATFSLRPQRKGKVALVILGGVSVGFLLYLLSNFVFALGLSAKLPVALAGWTPAGVSLLLGIAMLLHLEDG